MKSIQLICNHLALILLFTIAKFPQIWMRRRNTPRLCAVHVNPAYILLFYGEHILIQIMN